MRHNESPEGRSVRLLRVGEQVRHALSEVLKALKRNVRYLRGEVSRRVNTKYAADLKFLPDESFDEGSHIDRLLRSPKVAQDLDADRTGNEDS